MNTPNKITVSRLFIAFAMILFLVFPWWPAAMTDQLGSTGLSVVDIVATALFIAGALTDAVDGHLARRDHLVTDFGKFFDPLADKFLVNSALVILAVRSPDLLPVLIVVLMIGRDLAVDGLRLLAAHKGQVIAANIFGKLKTVCQMVAIPLVMLKGFPFNYWLKGNTYILVVVLVSITLAMSLVSGAIYLYRGRALLKGGK